MPRGRNSSGTILNRYNPNAKPRRCRYELVQADGRVFFQHDERGPLLAKQRIYGGVIRERAR